MENIKEFITSNANEKRAEFSRKLISTSYKIWGVETKQIESFAKRIANQTPPEKIQLDSHEAILIAGFALAYRSIPAQEKIKLLDKLIPYFDNWASVDMITCRLRDVESGEDYFVSLLNRKSPFEKRVGIIYLMRFKLKENPQKYISLLLNAHDENYYVKMAKAWAISECALLNFDLAKKVIENQSDTFIKSKSISKCCDSFRLTTLQKAELKKLR